MSKARWVYVGGAVLAAVLVASAVASARRAERFEVEARLALVSKVASDERADSLLAESKRKDAVADSLAKQAKKITTRVVEKIVRLPRLPADDTVIVRYTAPRDSVISEQRQAINLWEIAYDSLNTSHTDLKGAYAIARASSDSLAAVLRSRPKPGFKILPELGVFAGGAVTPAGFQPAVGVGFVWRL